MLGVFFIGWMLTWFGVDDLIVDGINQLCNTNYNLAVYWLIIFILAIIVLIKGD